MAKVAYNALCTLGFKQTEARAAVDSIRERIEPQMSREQVVTIALGATLSLPSQRRISGVREEMAVYLPSWAVG